MWLKEEPSIRNVYKHRLDKKLKGGTVDIDTDW
jgi:hypothetical protein